MATARGDAKKTAMRFADAQPRPRLERFGDHDPPRRRVTWRQLGIGAGMFLIGVYGGILIAVAIIAR